MFRFLYAFIVHRVQIKAIAFLLALFIWFFVNHSITTEITLPNILVKVKKLPAEKTIQGISPEGFLPQKVTLTLSGTKSIVENLTADDIQVILNAENREGEWLARVTKKNLISTNRELSLYSHLKHVVPIDIPIAISNLITEVVPVNLSIDHMDSFPEGYQFLDIWPQTLFHTVTGPEEQVLEWKKKHFTLRFDMRKVSKKKLDILSTMKEYLSEEEVHFFIPRKEKKIQIPFLSEAAQEINDPRAGQLRLHFLKKRVIPLKQPVPLYFFYPLQQSEMINPTTYPLKIKPPLFKKNGLLFLNLPLSVQNVSPLFLEVVRDFLALSVVIAPYGERERFFWSSFLINMRELEEKYIQTEITRRNPEEEDEELLQQQRALFRERFQNYAQQIQFLCGDQLFELSVSLKEEGIELHFSSEIEESLKVSTGV